MVPDVTTTGHEGGGVVRKRAHLTKAVVWRGHCVEGEQLIAPGWLHGLLLGVHLHFQMWLDGRLLDPLNFVGSARVRSLD